MGSPLTAEAASKRILSAGGRLDYLSMDEPVMWGHVSPGNLCALSIPDLATEAAARVAVYQRYFPGIEVGLIDPVNSRFPSLFRDILDFVDQLRSKGIVIAFFHADVAWDSNWRTQFEELATGLHARGIKVGVICDGDIDARSDVMWTDEAVHNCATASRDPRIAPVEQLVIQSWSRYPSRILPETKSGTLTEEAKELMNSFH
jgi:hypothetical protein